MNKLNEDINALIANILPAQAANEMKRFIDDAQKLQDFCDHQEVIIQELNTKIRNLEGTLSSEEAVLAALDKAEKDRNAATLLNRESRELKDNVDMSLMRLRVEMMESNMANMWMLVDKVFGHPSVTIAKLPTPVAVPGHRGDQYGSGAQMGYVDRPLGLQTETTTEGKL